MIWVIILAGNFLIKGGYLWRTAYDPQPHNPVGTQHINIHRMPIRGIKANGHIAACKPDMDVAVWYSDGQYYLHGRIGDKIYRLHFDSYDDVMRWLDAHGVPNDVEAVFDSIFTDHFARPHRDDGERNPQPIQYLDGVSVPIIFPIDIKTLPQPALANPSLIFVPIPAVWIILNEKYGG